MSICNLKLGCEDIALLCVISGYFKYPVDIKSATLDRVALCVPPTCSFTFDNVHCVSEWAFIVAE